MDTFVSLATGLKELALGGAAIVGAWVAWRGVDAWRRQLRGKMDYDIGMSLLRAAFRLREAIALVRHPLMEVAEMDAALKETGEASESDDQASVAQERAQAAVYEVRWRAVGKAMSELDTARIEAEVLWGSEPSDRVRELRRLVGRLRWAVSTQLSGPDLVSQLSKNQRMEIRRVMYLGRDPDTYGSEIENAVAAIEDFVRPRLAA